MAMIIWAIMALTQASLPASTKNVQVGRPEWREVLQAVERDVCAALAHPVAYKFLYDRKWREFTCLLTVASHWPNDSFRDPLLQLLNGPDPSLADMAAEGLLRFHDAGLRERVEQYRHDPRRIGPEGLYTLGQLVSYSLETIGASPTSIKPVPEGLIELDEAGDIALDKIAIGGLPDALEYLRAQDLSVRLQAFVWLSSRVSLVLDAKPLAEAWSHLSDAARAAVLGCLGEVRWGRAELIHAIEPILLKAEQEHASAGVREGLFQVLGKLKSEAVRRPALEVIRAAFRRGTARAAGAPADDDCRLLDAAFSAFGRTATDADANEVLAWTESAAPAVRTGALYVAAHLDDERAVERVLAFIRWSDSAWSPNDPGLCEAFYEREWRNQDIKRAYVFGILETVEARTAAYGAALDVIRDAPLQAISLPTLIEMLEAITQTTQGPSGRLPGPMTYAVDLNTVRKTVGAWRAWARDKYPVKKADGD
jgi:HEAT repeat protein